MAVPIRSCIVCRKRENWTELLRVVRDGDQLIPDPNHRAPGRGAWLHEDCFHKAVERGSFGRALRTDQLLSSVQLMQYLSN